MPGHSQRRTEKRFRLQMQSSWGNTPALTQMTFTGFWITSIQTLRLPFYGDERHPDPTSLGYTKDPCTTRAWPVSCKIFKQPARADASCPYYQNAANMDQKCRHVSNSAPGLPVLYYGLRIVNAVVTSKLFSQAGI